MKKSDLPEKWQPSQSTIPDTFEPRTLFRQMAADIEKWMDPSHLKGVINQMQNQVQVKELTDAYVVSVFLNRVEKPDDIQAWYSNQQIHLRRIAQHEAQTSHDQGTVWQSYYEHFERSIPLDKPIRWESREVKTQKGCWQIRLPYL